MKLSEAIRLGAMLRPQGFGPQVVTERGSCVWGAAIEAIGQYPNVYWSRVLSKWPVATEPSVCPVLRCGTLGSVSGVMVHLNNDHCWTREKIAEWVATMEPNAQDPVAPPVERATLEGALRD